MDTWLLPMPRLLSWTIATGTAHGSKGGYRAVGVHALACLLVGQLGLCSSLLAADPAASPPPVFDIPRVTGIAVDGNAADWQERGFRVEVLNELNGRRRPETVADASLRLAWDERGLLGLVQVGDRVFAESGNDQTLWKQDSVELFMALGPEFKEYYQIVVSPGLDPMHPKVRTQILDRRQVQKTPLAYPLAVLRTPQGYDLEFLLPWANLTATPPAAGATFALQAQVNNAGGSGGNSLLAWFPATGAFADTGKMHRLRLAAAASPPVQSAAAAFYERFRRVRVEAVATAPFAGQTAVVRPSNSPGELGHAAEFATTAGSRLALARVDLPMPPPGYPCPPRDVLLAGKLIRTVTLPDADKERATALARAEIRFRPGYVFAAASFPEPEFRDASLMEDLIGPYALKTTWYNGAGAEVTQAQKAGRYGAIVEIVPEKPGAPLEKRFCTLFRQTAPVDWRQDRLTSTLALPAGIGISPDVLREQARSVSGFVQECVTDAFAERESAAIGLAGLAETTPGSAQLPRRLDPWSVNEKWWYTLKRQTGNLKPYQYKTYIPPNPEQNKERLPLLLFLHGAGERGDNLDMVAIHGPFKYLRGHPEGLPFMVVAPQCPPWGWWNRWLLLDLLDEVMAKYPVDPDRVYVTGLSMGGFGSWWLAMTAPERFAAVAPICGGGDPLDVERLKDLPFWVAHGGKDPVVPLTVSGDMVAALRAIHGRVRFTVIPEAGHDAWTPIYNNPEFYAWLLQQRRGAPAQPPATTTGLAGD